MAAKNMSKIAINNEIVLMRQAVRQSRVAVVRKLIKEAKLLQARKHGDEKVKEKCRRKAQRLVAEIAAIKKLKDDEISKFGVTNTSKLQEVLNDTKSEPATRVMTRMAFHKSLSDRIAKFKEKFPDYEQHLGPGRKKLSKIQRQANREARNALRKSGAPAEANGTNSTNEIEMDNEITAENANEESGGSSDEKDESNDESEGEEIEPAESSKIAMDVAEDSVESLATEPDKIEVDSTEDSAESLAIEHDAEPDKIEVDSTEDPDMTIAAEHGLEPGSILRIRTPSSTKKRKIEKDSSSDDHSETETAEDAIKTVEQPKRKKESKTKSVSQNPVESTSPADEPSEKPKAMPKKKKKTRDRKIAKKAPAEPKKPKPIKVVSKEATVRRFADLMDDKQPEELIEAADVGSSSRKRDVKIEKEVDSFFMTENGESEYLSVVVPRAKPSEDNEEDERFGQNHAAKRQQNFHERNNKFFSKIDQRANGGYGDKFAANGDKYGANGGYGDKFGGGGKHRQNDFGGGGRQRQNDFGGGGRQRQNDFGNGRAPEKFGRNSNGPARAPRNGRPEFEKKSEPKDEELHPSWAARKKQQEILKQGFQGKKIVFDD